MKKLLVVILLLCAVSLAVTEDSKVLAVVNNEPITAKDVQDKIELFPMQQQVMLSTEEGRKIVLDELVRGKVFYLAAKEQQLDQDQEIAQRIENIRRQFVVIKYLNNLLDKVSVTEEQQRKYFEENKKDFVKDEVWAAHILVNDEKKAQDIYENLKAGADFAEIAKKESVDTVSGKNGGDLGWFGRGRMIKDFEDQAFALKKGEISKPFKTEFGYHIIKLIDRSGAVKYEDVVVDVRNKALESERSKVLENKYKELLKKYPAKFEN
jgi:peptidyl-prolyl cis-trans isomerase C